jgi:toxin ParE1/3/4
LDLDRIAESAGKHSPTATDRILDTLSQTFRTLAQNPYMGTLRDDLRPNLRVFSLPRPAQNYVVLFYPSAGGVEIVGIYHAAQDWPSEFLRGK